ncbi:MAG: phosphate acyltransferase PlsX [Solirubrobacterales bacterium]
MSEAPSRPGPEAPVALDAQGADGGPAVAIEGARIAAASGIAVRLFAPASLEVPEGVELVPCEDAIGNDVEPVAAVRSTPDASVVRAAADVAAGRSGALVSAGSTGAAMTAALFVLRRIKGVHRPALAVQVPLPGTSGRTLLFLDCGANTEARPQHLIQFAHLGAAFSESVLGIERPRVGLLSVGEEQKKGRPDVVEANAALREAGGIEFVGNVEGRDLLTGVADVIVTDGFTGNVALKTLEGTARAVADAVRAAARSNPIAMAGGALMRPALGQLREAMDPNAVGGAILLGLNGVAVVAHGSSSPEGIANAVRLAQRCVREREVERTAERLRASGATREALRDGAAPSAGHEGAERPSGGSG